MKSIEYYLSKGFDRPMAEYFASGRKKIVSVTPNDNFTLNLKFDNGETRLFDCNNLLKTGTVFEREGSEISLGASINKSSINRSVNPKMPYLSFLAINYNIPVIAEVHFMMLKEMK